MEKTQEDAIQSASRNPKPLPRAEHVSSSLELSMNSTEKQKDLFKRPRHKRRRQKKGTGKDSKEEKGDMRH